ncbi:MAG TPA: DUF3095 domain-containing protein [Xanthobacteraceae bacterium]|nr:DUF3095 domain-containing protein [Xanthobacteraceae bacterium]
MASNTQATGVFDYEALPLITRFDGVVDETAYYPVPDDWSIALTDVVDSTSELLAGRYKTVNYAGAAVIAAVRNALGGAQVPFVFGGDGACVLLAPDQGTRADAALAATVAWTRDELGLVLRAARIGVGQIRAAGYDLKVARYAPSPDIAYAMFDGGGLAWADRALKQGLHAVEAAPPGTLPDLSGLSCRFEPSAARNGLVLSVMASPTGQDAAAAREVMERIIRLVESSPAMGRPTPDEGPPLHWPPAGLELEAHATHKHGQSLASRRVAVYWQTLLAYLILRLRIPVGRFAPTRYLRQVAANADFRKYDDGLRMTIDCSEATAAAIERELRAAEAAGLVHYGLHRQNSALMTCIVPSPTSSNHVHFVDGSGGGYARAAQALKAKHPSAPGA